MNQRKLALSIALGAMLTLGLVAGLGFSRPPAQASPEAASSAHVVVQFADGNKTVRPITWVDSITRVGALKAAGLSVEHSDNAVCNIEGEGCPATDCFCADNLWAQGQWDGTAWDTAAWPPPELVDGDVIAFRNGTQPDFSDWGLTGLLPGAPTFVAASNALEWMRDQQQPDGSYDDLGKIGASVRALIALGAASYDPADWGNPSLLNFITVISRSETVDYAATSASSAGKLAVGAAWTGQTVTDFAGINLPMSITTYYSPTTGAYGYGSGDTAWAMLGLYAAGEGIPAQTISFLKDAQNADGGWSWNEWSTTSELQHTALCVQALLAAGEPVTATEVMSALTLINSARNDDGGYGYAAGDASDLSTTGYVIQSLLSAGQGPDGNWCTPIRGRYLLTEQGEDGSYGGFSPLYATQEAIPALMHRPFGPLASWTYNCYLNYLPLISSSAASGS